MNNNIFVTIVCVTYNHQNYIRDALDSFFHQQVDFKYEVVVHDDASTDETIAILKEYEKEYPDKIKVLYEAENQYRKTENFVKFLQERVLPFVRGKYVVISEGDDYWIDDTKLQRQVDYLEKNADCMMVTHNAVTLNMRSAKIDILTRYYSDKDLSAEEIINHPCGYMATASMLMRRECFELIDFFNEAEIGDYTRQLSCLARGKIHYIDRVMSVYRFAHPGSWQELQDKDSFLRINGYLKMIRFLDKYNAYTKYIYSKYLSKEIQRYASYIIMINNKENFEEAFEKELFNESYKQYLDYIIKLHKQVKDKHYLDNGTLSFMQKYKHILIMGAGEYASVLANQIENSGRDFDGFVVSPNQDAKTMHMGKKIYVLDKIPYNIQETGVLVGINAIKWDEIEDTLLTYQISNYFCPYLFETGYNNNNI